MPTYDFCCPACGIVAKDVYMTMKGFDNKRNWPKCVNCEKRMCVSIGNVRVAIGKIGTRYPMRLCESCRLRDRVAANYPKGCDNGKRCKGYTPFDQAAVKKKLPAEENLRKNYPERLKNLKKGRTFKTKRVLHPQ